MSPSTQFQSDPPTVNPREATLAWLEAGNPVAVASVIDTWGSAPVRPGGELALASKMEFVGSVSGGCSDDEVIAAGLEVLRSGEPRMLALSVDDASAWQAGLACGGKLRVFISRLDPSRDLEFARSLAAAAKARKPIVVAIHVAGGAREILDESSERGDVLPRLRSGQSGLDPSGEFFLQALTPAARVVIVGATQISQHLGRMAAACGYDVRAIEPRRAFTDAFGFDASRMVVEPPAQALAAFPLDPFTALVTVSHVDEIDDAALTMALKSTCGYIGSLGSRRTHAKRVERLKAAGFSDADVARIHAPVGLAIGAVTPAEIAISILSQIIATLRTPKAA